MKLLANCSVSIFMLLTTQVFALPLLSYPVAQPPECNQSYENAPEPKSFEQVYDSLQKICIERGGVRLTNKWLKAGNSSEPIDVVIGCIAENPTDYVKFHCTYGTIGGL